MSDTLLFVVLAVIAFAFLIWALVLDYRLSRKRPISGWTETLEAPGSGRQARAMSRRSAFPPLAGGSRALRLPPRLRGDRGGFAG